MTSTAFKEYHTERGCTIVGFMTIKTHPARVSRIRVAYLYSTTNNHKNSFKPSIHIYPIPKPPLFPYQIENSDSIG